MMLLSPQSTVSITGQNTSLFPFLLRSLFFGGGRRWQGLLLILLQSKWPAEQEVGQRCCTPLTLINITGWSLGSAVFLGSPPHFQHLGFWKTRIRRLSTYSDSDTEWWEAKFKPQINMLAKAEGCFLDWHTYKLEDCEKHQPTNCIPHWFFALGFSVLSDKNNYVILMWLPSIPDSHSTCDFK